MSFEFRQVFLPYCLHRQPDGRYAVLNRQYKPLGFLTSDYVTYADYPILVTLKMTPKLAAALSCHGHEDIERIYLYNDGCVPTDGTANWKAYQEKLARLATLSTS